MKSHILFLSAVALPLLVGCLFDAAVPKSNPLSVKVDVLIRGGTVFDGSKLSDGQVLDVGILGERIVAVAKPDEHVMVSDTVIDAQGMIVSPGFIDPHTHSLADLTAIERAANLNYLHQGVTTVVNGNDGAGSPHVLQTLTSLSHQGMGTNLALFVGHGAIRQAVMGRENRPPTSAELTTMKQLTARAMTEGALGLSSGLHYVPGSFADTQELIALAKVAGQHGGIYESHIRDESSYSIGLIGAIEEIIEIGKAAQLPVHIAHIKALGVDVWGQSTTAVKLVEDARKEGLAVTADQYPWRASGTGLRSALVPQAIRAGGDEAFYRRLQDPRLRPQISTDVTENIRRRGGPDSLLIIDSYDGNLLNRTLADIATDWDMAPTDTALRIIRGGYSRVASFNMIDSDIEHFIQQPWVMTSSDGNDGHPRKYASYPKKYRDYVIDKKLLSMTEFVHRSTGLVANTLNLPQRGYLKPGYFADIIVFSPDDFRPKANFQNWNQLSEGMEYVWVNGALTIQNGEYTGALNGRGLTRTPLPSRDRLASRVAQ